MKTITALWIVLMFGAICALKSYGLNVKDYGAVGDGVADDTIAIQKAIDVSRTVLPGSTGPQLIEFEKKKYLITHVDIYPGAALLGHDATIMMKAKADRWTRMFQVCGKYMYKGATDSKKVTISNFQFDGQKDLQDATLNLEHQAAIFITASDEMPGRVVVEINQSIFKNLAGDAVFFYDNSDLTIKNTYYDNVKRCNLGTSGGNNRLLADGLYATSSGGHFDMEPYAGTTNNQLVIRNMVTDRADFGVSSSNSSLLVENVTVNRSTWFLTNPTSTLTVKGSTFYYDIVNGGMILKAPGKLTSIEDSNFIMIGPGRTVASPPLTKYGFQITWYNWLGQKAVISRCKFYTGAGIFPTDTLKAIYLEAGKASDTNELVLDGVHVSSIYDIGFAMSFGGRVKVSNSIFDSYWAGQLNFRDDLKYPKFFYDVEWKKNLFTKKELAPSPVNAGNRLVVEEN